MNERERKYDSDVYSVEKEEIERELNRGFFDLEFSEPVERKFKKYCFEQIKGSMRFTVFLGIFIFFISGAMDAIIYPRDYKMLFTLRYLIGGPLLLLAAYFIMKAKNETQIQLLFSFALFVAGIIIIGMIFLVNDPTQRYYAGLTIVMLYAYIAVGLRFKYTFVIGWMLTFVYYFLVFLIKFPAENFFVSNFFFLIFFNLIGIISSFLYEKNQRKLFLLSSLIVQERKELEKANKKLKELSITDPLTGIPNRRHFHEFFKIEWRRAKRYKEPISVILLDIDFFKNYNDSLGHQKGDIVLRRVAQKLKEITRRPGDLVSRFGGEEFIIILSKTPIGPALDIAEKIRKSVLNLKIRHPSSGVSDVITVSLGVASVIPEKNMVNEALIKAADEALYEAKRKGRNRVEKKEVKKA